MLELHGRGGTRTLEGRKKQKDTLVRMVGVQTYKIISVNTCRSYIDYMMLQ